MLQVLRFYAYFQEAVHERAEEQFRVRRCTIYFYLEDDTIQVNESQQVNSGIPQGKYSWAEGVANMLGVFLQAL